MGVMQDLVRRAKNIIIAADQLFGCVITLGDAYPDETPSSYAWRLEQKGRPWGRIWRPVIDAFFLALAQDVGHCHQSYLSERERRHSPIEFRN